MRKSWKQSYSLQNLYYLTVICIVTCLELEYHERDDNLRSDYKDSKSSEPGELFYHFL